VLATVGSLGTEIESASGDIGWPPTRTSPNRGSCWLFPATPSAWPPAATRPMLMFALTAHVWNAWRTWRWQAAVDPREAFSVWNSVLVCPAMGVPSGTKLRVRWLGSLQGTPNVAGTARSSSDSTEKRVRRVPLEKDRAIASNPAPRPESESGLSDSTPGGGAA